MSTLKKKVSAEMAELDLNRWLDFKKISDGKREQNKETIKTLLMAIEEGALIVNEDHTLTYHLKFPIVAEETTETLTFKSRLSVSEVHRAVSGIKIDNIDGRLLAYSIVLSGKVKGLLEKLDTEDYAVATSIAVFFL